MYKIQKAEKLADKIYLMDVEAPRVARHCQPGQFIIVKMDEKEREFLLLFATLTVKRALLQLCSRQWAHLQKRWHI